MMYIFDIEFYCPILHQSSVDFFFLFLVYDRNNFILYVSADN